MAVAAFKLEPEQPVEERIARIEVTVEHIQADVSDLKTDVRKLNEKIDGVDQKLTAKIDTHYKEMMAEFQKLTVGHMANRVWFLLILGGIITGIAKAFKWI